MSVSSLVSGARKKKGLTQEELAAQTKVTVRTIQRIESGESIPRSFTLKAIASALDIPFETFTATEIATEVPVTPLTEKKGPDPDSVTHFLQVFCLSCFSYMIIPYVHFLIPLHLLKKNKELSPVVKHFARHIIRLQVGWVVSFHLLLLLTLAYNIVLANYGNRQYLINYLWVVLVMYLINAILVIANFQKARKLPPAALII